MSLWSYEIIGFLNLLDSRISQLYLFLKYETMTL